MRWANSILLVPWLLIIIGPAALGAISPDNVLVLYNPAWSDGTHNGSYIATQYASSRGIPLSNVIGLDGLGTSENISASDYLTIIRPQVEAALGTRTIDTIVTTKGLPLKITNDLANPADPNDPNGYQYTDASGIPRTMYYDWWQPYSSLESELTRINTIGVQNGPDWLHTAQVQMGDQSYTPYSVLPYLDPADIHFVNNPYYQGYSQSTNSFSHTDSTLGGMYLTSRLDGYTVSDVMASIKNAQNAFLLPNSSLIVIDNDPNADIADRLMVDQLKVAMDASGQKTVYNQDSTAITNVSGPVIGYDSHGVHGSGFSTDYIVSQLKRNPNSGTGLNLADGAVFNTHESYNAYTFNGQPGNNPKGQGLVADWLAIGGTAGVGNVEEPLNGFENEANEDQMFKMLLDGYTWGEAAWSSLYQLSSVNTVVGDPLMTWKKVLPGDADLDGAVGSSDLAILGADWGMTGDADGAMWKRGDFNCDGLVGSADLALLAANWGLIADWATADTNPPSGPLDTKAFLEAIPEPSTTSLLITGLLALIAAYIWLGQRPPLYVEQSLLN
jgi:hypothetical protein